MMDNRIRQAWAETFRSFPATHDFSFSCHPAGIPKARQAVRVDPGTGEWAPIPTCGRQRLTMKPLVSHEKLRCDFYRVLIRIEARLLGRHYNGPSHLPERVWAIGVIEDDANGGHLHGMLQVASHLWSRLENTFPVFHDTAGRRLPRVRNSRPDPWTEICPAGSYMVRRFAEKKNHDLYADYITKTLTDQYSGDRVLFYQPR